MTQVVLSKLAELDLAEITDFIALDNPARADSFEDELLACSVRIGQAPLAYRARPELGEGVRACPHGRYVLFFTVSDQGVRIERILHGSRDLDALFQI